MVVQLVAAGDTTTMTLVFVLYLYCIVIIIVVLNAPTNVVVTIALVFVLYQCGCHQISNNYVAVVTIVKCCGGNCKQMKTDVIKKKM